MMSTCSTLAFAGWTSSGICGGKFSSARAGGAILSDEMSDLLEARRDVADAADRDEAREELARARSTRTRASAASAARCAASSSASRSSMSSPLSDKMCWIVSDLVSSITAAIAPAGSVDEIVSGVAADRDEEEIDTACCDDDKVNVSGVDAIA